MRFLQAAVLILASLAPRAEAAAVRLAPVDRPLTVGTTFSMPISVEGSTRPFGGYLFDLAFDHGLLTLESLAPEGDHAFSDEFFKNSGIGMGGGQMAGLNSRSLSGPVGSANLTVARFRVIASSAIFVASQLRNSNVTVSVREAVDMVDTRASTIAVTGATLAFEVVGDTLAPVTRIEFTPPSALSDAEGRPIISTSALVGFSAQDLGAYLSGIAQTGYLVDQDTMTTALVTATAPFALAAGTHTLVWSSRDNAGNVEVVKSTQVLIKPEDVTPPSLTLTPVSGSTATTATPELAASYFDLESGVSTATARLFLDDAEVTGQAVVTASSASFVPAAALTQGTHTASAQVLDRAGNSAATRVAFFIDSIPPFTLLLVNGLATGSTELVVISTDSLGFTASDDGTGVMQTLYALDGSTTPAVFVSTFSLGAGTHTLAFHSMDHAGNAETPRFVTLTAQAEDQTPPTVSLSPPDGSTVTMARPAIVASYLDALSEIDISSVRLSFDDIDVTTQAAITASSASFIPASDLSQGTHTATAVVSDSLGNRSTATATFLVDSIAPVTALLVNGLVPGSTNLVLVSTDIVGFVATDGGTGVVETLYSLDGAAEAAFVSTFTLSPGDRSVAFRSRDQAGNLEAARIVAIFVRSPSFDTTAPVVRLDFPGAAAVGVEQAVAGVVNVRGGASDASSFTWLLEAAPGLAATSGFATIASGAENVSGLITAWNTTSLSGYQTLRLSATDSTGNAGSISATAFVGKPVFTFAIGRKDSNVVVNTIKNPTGIAVRSDGHIWVANTDKDELILLTSSGAVVAKVDGRTSHGGGHGRDDDDDDDDGDDNDDDDDDDNENKAGGFKSPQGLSLDAANSLYVADKANDRVVKLSVDGSQILLQIAKLDNRGRPKAGSAAGELRRPQDVAVDSNGDIYVADSGNHRVQVFNAAGAFLRQFGSGVLLSTSEVRGIALTVEGLWVSDKGLERIFLFSRAGSLLKSIGDADSAVGEISRTRGLASDSHGALYVVEPNRDRAQKFDAHGKGLFAFGSKAALGQADKQARRYLTQPLDAAVGPDGSIWITDTGRDRIVRYALPSSGGYGVAAYSAGGGDSSSGSVEPARRLVDATDGAKVERDDGAGVHVPEGALAVDLEITVDKGDENQDKEQKTAKRLELKIQAVSEEVQYGPEGTTFNTPVTLILPYDANLIASQGLKEDELKAYYWNPTLKDWQIMPSTVDKENKTVSAQTTHFSAYQLGALGGIGVAAVDDFGFRDGYAFPNPARDGSAVTFRMQPGSADSIEVRVYDVSGRKVHSSSDFRFRGAFDDGNGKGAQNTYDHVWDVSGIGSGVYNYVMTAKKTGEKDIRKTGKAGVIK